MVTKVIILHKETNSEMLKNQLFAFQSTKLMSYHVRRDEQHLRWWWHYYQWLSQCNNTLQHYSFVHRWCWELCWSHYLVTYYCVSTGKSLNVVRMPHKWSWHLILWPLICLLDVTGCLSELDNAVIKNKLHNSTYIKLLALMFFLMTFQCFL